MQYIDSSCFEHELCRKAVLHYIFGFPEENKCFFKRPRQGNPIKYKKIFLRDSENEKYLTNLLSWSF